jgi:predicted RNase H-like HicB family nuclease
MSDLRKRTAMVVDNGLFLEIAIRLSKEFGRVLYFAPWTNGYPKSNALMIGKGIDNIERVEDPWSHIDDVDVWVFPDVYEGAMQDYLVSHGHRVWGCRSGGAELELDRVKSKETSKRLGIDIGPYKRIIGLDALRRHLKANDDQYVKISATRGDMETFGAPTYEEVEPRLDELEHNLGAKKKIMEFVVEEGINDAIEIGYDGFTIDGQFARGAIVGVEVKDKAYIGRTMRYNQLPPNVRDVNEKLAPELKRVGYRGFISTEIRETKDKAYLIDPCSRAGSPPSELYQEMIGNLAEVIWWGAEGIVIEPEYTHKWGAEVLLLSDWADKNWQQVRFPEEIRENVKLRNFTVIDGEYYVIPQWSGMPEIGAVVATGNTAEEAISECKRIAALVDGYSVEKPLEAIDEAYENLKKALGEKADKPISKEQSAAEEAMRAGKISSKQYDKIAAREGWI